MPFDESSGRTEAGRGMPRSALSLLLICVFTFFIGLGRPAITDADEAYYAEASREMVETGDWLTPRFNYQDRWQKPVLYYWLTAAIFRVAGPSEWGARAWAALSGVGLVLLTWSIARRTGSDERAWLAGAIVATSLGYFPMARAALPDLPLTFCITCTIWSSLRALDDAGRSNLQWAIAGAAAGLGFLFKGPVALVIPVVVLVPVWLRERRRVRLTISGLAIAALVFALVGLPWYVAMWRAHGDAYLQSFFVGDNLERFTTERFNEARPLWFYLPVVAGGMLPWTVYLVVFAVRPMVDALRRVRRLTDEEWRLLLWAAMPLIFYTVSIGKQPRYILPVLPPLGILLAGALARRIATRRDDGSVRQPGLTATTWITAAMFALLAVLLLRLRPLLVDAYPPAPLAGTLAIAIGAIAIAAIVFTRAWRRLALTMTVAGTALLLAVQFAILDGRDPEPVEQMASIVRDHRAANEPIGVYKAFVRNLVFYTHTRQVDFYDADAAAEFLRSAERVLLVVPEQDLAVLRSSPDISVQELGEVSYLNTANIRLRTLVRPDPASEIQRVLLVSNR